MLTFKVFIKKFWSQGLTGNLLLKKEHKYFFNSLLSWDVIPFTVYEDISLKRVNFVVIAGRTLRFHKFYIQTSEVSTVQ